MRRDWYLQDWEMRTIEKNGKKKMDYVYVGHYYGYSLEKNDLIKLKLAHIAPALLLPVIYIIAAVIGQENYEQFFVGMPFLFAMIPYMPYFVGVVILVYTKERLTYRDYFASYQRIDFWIKALLILFIIATLGSLVSLIMAFANPELAALRLPRAVFLLCMLASVGCCCFTKLLLYKFPCRRLYIPGLYSEVDESEDNE